MSIPAEKIDDPVQNVRALVFGDSADGRLDQVQVVQRQRATRRAEYGKRRIVYLIEGLPEFGNSFLAAG